MIEKNKYGLSRGIPEDIKRLVRQACGFGCVYCGFAIASYEHIEPEFHEARTLYMDPDKIAFLCERCHSRVTRNFWSKEKIKKARKAPWCLNLGKCHDAFDIGSNELVVFVGTNKIVNIETIFKVNDTILLSIEQPEAVGEPYRLSGNFYDEDGSFLFKIIKNEWIGNASNWDMECVGGRIMIRTKPNNIALQILCNPPYGIIIEKMNMFYKNTLFIADQYELRVKTHDRGTVVICGREVKAETEGCFAFTAVSKGEHHEEYGGGVLEVGTGGALRIGGGGTFSIASIPKPNEFPNTRKGHLLERRWGEIRLIVPPKKSQAVGRNDQCPCKSGLKHKKCCGK